MEYRTTVGGVTKTAWGSRARAPAGRTAAVAVACLVANLGTVRAALHPGQPIDHVAPAPALVVTPDEPSETSPTQPEDATGRATDYDIGSLTDDAQYMVELVNRARADAHAEGQRLVTTTDPEILDAYDFFSVDLDQLATVFTNMSPQSLPPLVPNARNGYLRTAAGFQTSAMEDCQCQEHDHPGDPFRATLEDRATFAQYTGPWNVLTENIYAYAKSLDYAHAAFLAEWGQGDRHAEPADGSPTNTRAVIYDQGAREIGIAVSGIVGNLQPSRIGPLVLTQNFGARPSTPTCITGVAYYDVNGNGLYDPKEGGLPGIKVTVDGGSYEARTRTGGGYAVPVPADGTYSVTFAPAGGVPDHVVTNIQVTDGNNTKVDYVPPYTPPVISGPVGGRDAMLVGQTSEFGFSQVPLATEYDYRVKSLTPSTWVEGAEEVDPGDLTISATAGYDVIQVDTVASGEKAFRLIHADDPVAGPRAQLVTLSRSFWVDTGGSLAFAHKMGVLNDSQVARVQVSTNGRATWHDIWRVAGTGTADPGFSLVNVSLAAFAEREIDLRFLLHYDPDASFYDGSGPEGDAEGWFFDDIQLTGCYDVTQVVANDTHTPTSFTFKPLASGLYALEVRGVRDDPYESPRGTRELPYGPAILRQAYSDVDCGEGGDLMGDEWELLIAQADLLDNIYNACDVLADDDFDGDGETNKDEWDNDTDPTDARSTTEPANTYTDFDFLLFRRGQQTPDRTITTAAYGAELQAGPAGKGTIVAWRLVNPDPTEWAPPADLVVVPGGLRASFLKDDYADVSALQGFFKDGGYRVFLRIDTGGRTTIDLRFRLTVEPYDNTDFPDYVNVVDPPPDSLASLTPLVTLGATGWHRLRVADAVGDVLYDHDEPTGGGLAHQIPGAAGLTYSADYELRAAVRQPETSWLASETVSDLHTGKPIDAVSPGTPAGLGTETVTVSQTVSVDEDQTLTFAVALAAGGGPFHFAWEQDGMAVGSDAATYDFSPDFDVVAHPAASAPAGAVTCAVTDDNGAAVASATWDLVAVDDVDRPTAAPTVSISPDPAVTIDDLTGNVDLPAPQDPDGDAVTDYTYSWDRIVRDRAPIQGQTLDAANTRKGETWEATVFAKTNPYGTGDVTSTLAAPVQIVIDNSVPVIGGTATVTPGNPVFDSPLSVDTSAATVTDPDIDDGVDTGSFTYQWQRKPAAAGAFEDIVDATGSILLPADFGNTIFTRGDQFQCVVGASDGTALSTGTLTAGPVTIGNTDPGTPGDVAITVYDEAWKAAPLTATDPDGDTVSYILRSLPARGTVHRTQAEAESQANPIADGELPLGLPSATAYYRVNEAERGADFADSFTYGASDGVTRGASAGSGTVTVTYYANRLPVVFLVTPNTGTLAEPQDQNVDEGDSVAFSATFTDDGDINPDGEMVRIDWYVDGNLQPASRALLVGTFTFETDLDTVANGPGGHRPEHIVVPVQAVGVDNGGGQTTVTWQVTVNDIDRQPPAPTVSIAPEPAVTTDDLAAHATPPPPVDPDGDTITGYAFSWEHIVRGRAPIPGPTLDRSNTAKGQTWQLTGYAQTNPYDAGPVTSPVGGTDQVTIDNTAPAIGGIATITPANPLYDSTLTVDPTAATITDPDVDDGVDTVNYTYRWQRKPAGAGTFGDIPGATDSGLTPADVGTATFARGDQFQCIVGAADGEAPSTSTLTAGPVTIGNTDPDTPDDVAITLYDKAWKAAHLAAIDPDGDDVTYILRTRPTKGTVHRTQADAETQTNAIEEGELPLELPSAIAYYRVNDAERGADFADAFTYGATDGVSRGPSAGSGTVSITYVANRTPQVVAVSPGIGPTPENPQIQEGESVTFAAEFTDENDPNPAADMVRIDWYVDSVQQPPARGPLADSFPFLTSFDTVANGPAGQRPPQIVVPVEAIGVDNGGGETRVTWLVTVNDVDRPPPAPLVTIAPDPAVTTDDLTANANPLPLDPDGDEVIGHSYVWEQPIRGRAQIPGQTLDSSNTARGQTWEVTAYAQTNPYDTGPLTSPLGGTDHITIGNTVPVLGGTVTVAPASPVYDSALAVDTSGAAITDPDIDDGVDTADFTYQWHRKTAGSADFAPVPGATYSSLLPADVGDAIFTRDDQFQCIVGASDGTADSTATLTAGPVTINNTDPPAPDDVSITIYDQPWKAADLSSTADPDGDAVTTTIRSVPTRGTVHRTQADAETQSNAVTVDQLPLELPSATVYYRVNDPERGDDFTDSFTYGATDGVARGPSAGSGTVTINYFANRVPEILAVTPNTGAQTEPLDQQIGEGDTVQFGVTFTDDNDPSQTGEMVRIDWYVGGTLQPPPRAPLNGTFLFVTGFDTIQNTPAGHRPPSVALLVEAVGIDNGGGETRAAWQVTVNDVDRPPPAPAVAIGPANPTTAAALTAAVAVDPVDPDGDEVTGYTYAWDTVGPGPGPIPGQTLDSGNTAKGETWQVTVRTRTDPYGTGDVESPLIGTAQITIENGDPPAPDDVDIDIYDQPWALVNLSGGDPDGDPVTYIIRALPGKGVLYPTQSDAESQTNPIAGPVPVTLAGATVHYRVNDLERTADFTDTFAYGATDGLARGESAGSGTVTVTYFANRNPAVVAVTPHTGTETEPQDQEIDEGDSLEFSATFSDDGDPSPTAEVVRIDWYVDGARQGVPRATLGDTFTLETSFATIANDLSGHRPQQVAFTVSAVAIDNGGGEVTAAWLVTVNDVDQPAPAPTVSITPPDPTTTNDLVADVPLDPVDPDGDTVTGYTHSWDTVARDRAPVAGQTLDSSNTMKGQTWEATAAAQTDPYGVGPTDSPLAGTARVAIGNTPPTVAPQGVIVPSNTLGALIALTASDPDVDQGVDSFTFDITDYPATTADGTLSGLDHHARTVVYLPKNGFLGLDGFTYTVSDGDVASGAAQVVLDVRRAWRFVIHADDGQIQDVELGIEPLATGNFDPGIDIAHPGPPAPGVAEIHLVANDDALLQTDLRDGLVGLVWPLDLLPGATSVDLSWNAADVPAEGLRLWEVTGTGEKMPGTTIDMALTTQLTIPAGSARSFMIAGLLEADVPFRAGWNAFSLPLEPALPEPADVLAAARNGVLYSGRVLEISPIAGPFEYVPATELVALIGYWAYFPVAQTVTVVGRAPVDDTPVLDAGWHFRGPSLPGTVFSDPAAVAAWWWNGRYYEWASHMVPGRGYLFYLSQPTVYQVTR